ncbi:MAG: pyridoxamine 5'-phosphate oxidase family protein [Tannerellaceae bacterium]|jgi:general stress protein 26|nr:pyridoxamine 5'-phosphate oxidase family protein [Tannerellaceae bacterium]
MKRDFMDLAMLERFVGRQKVALVGSVDGDGFPAVKAMLMVKKREGIRVFYFSTNTSSMRVGQFRENGKACLYFYRKAWFRYQGLMLRGQMDVLEDADIKLALWQRGDEMFYPAGPSDPDYCVLRFTAVEARYYCNLHTESVRL